MAPFLDRLGCCAGAGVEALGLWVLDAEAVQKDPQEL
jgi:hypothetical protein